MRACEGNQRHPDCVVGGAQVFPIENRSASVWHTMGRRIDTDDLLTAAEVADLLGFSRRQVVSIYVRRYERFPRPVVVKSNGRTQLWARDDVERWDRERRASLERVGA